MALQNEQNWNGAGLRIPAGLSPLIAQPWDRFMLGSPLNDDSGTSADPVNGGLTNVGPYAPSTAAAGATGSLAAYHRPLPAVPNSSPFGNYGQPTPANAMAGGPLAPSRISPYIGPTGTPSSLGSPRIVKDATGFTRKIYPGGRIVVIGPDGQPSTTHAWGQAIGRMRDAVAAGQSGVSNSPAAAFAGALPGAIRDSMVNLPRNMQILGQGVGDEFRDTLGEALGSGMPGGLSGRAGQSVQNAVGDVAGLGLAPAQAITTAVDAGSNAVAAHWQRQAAIGAAAAGNTQAAQSHLNAARVLEAQNVATGKGIANSLGIIGSSGGYSGSLPQRIANATSELAHGNAQPMSVVAKQVVNFGIDHPVQLAANLWVGGSGALAVGRHLGAGWFDTMANRMQQQAVNARISGNAKMGAVYDNAAQQYSQFSARLKPPPLSRQQPSSASANPTAPAKAGAVSIGGASPVGAVRPGSIPEPSGQPRPQIGGLSVNGGIATGPTTVPKKAPLVDWLADKPDLLNAMQNGYNQEPQWQGINPNETQVYLRSGAEVKAIRTKQGERGGHHPHGLALGGPEGQNLTPTGDTRFVVNPKHAAVTALHIQVIRVLKGKQ